MAAKKTKRRKFGYGKMAKDLKKSSSVGVVTSMTAASVPQLVLILNSEMTLRDVAILKEKLAKEPLIKSVHAKFGDFTVKL